MGWAGESCALLAAASWALSSLLFHRVRVPAAGINLFKNVAAAALLLVTLAGVAWVGGGAVFRASPEAWGWLAISAVIGLFLGDTFHFRSLQILGPRRALLLDTLAPPLSAWFGFVVLGERITSGVGLGMAVTLAGIAWVIVERTRVIESAGYHPGSLAAGVAYGVLASTCQALGAAFSKLGMLVMLDGGVESHVALEATVERLLVAVAVGLVFALPGRRLARWWSVAREPGQWRALALAAFLATYLGVWLSLLSFQFTTVAIAGTLLATAPILVLPLVRFVLLQPITPRAALGALVAVAGVAILFAV